MTTTVTRPWRRRRAVYTRHGSTNVGDYVGPAVGDFVLHARKGVEDTYTRGPRPRETGKARRRRRRWCWRTMGLLYTYNKANVFFWGRSSWAFGPPPPPPHSWTHPSEHRRRRRRDASGLPPSIGHHCHRRRLAQPERARVVAVRTFVWYGAADDDVTTGRGLDHVRPKNGGRRSPGFMKRRLR